MDKTFAWVALVALFMLISAVIAYKKRDKSRTNALLSQWGASSSPRKPDPDSLPAISSFWRLLSPDKTNQVDDLTWNDLDMDILYAHLDRAQSNAGEAVLYALLRQTDAKENKLKKRDQVMRAFDEHPRERVKIQKILMKLGLDHRHNTYLYLKNPDASLPRHTFIYPLLAVLPVIFLSLGVFFPVFLLGIALSFALNLFVFYNTTLKR